MTDARPILFSPPMVRALIAGNKTQTRRILKPQPPKWVGAYNESDAGKHFFCEFDRDDDSMRHWPDYYNGLKCPYGKAGDLLWVREAWAVDAPLDQVRAEHEDALGPTFGHGPYYKTDPAHENSGLRWRRAMFMPRWASRLTLEVVQVRAQRLNDISKEDAFAEGVTQVNKHYCMDWTGLGKPRTDIPSIPPGMVLREENIGYDHALGAFAAYFEKLNGDDTWKANPWVWAITFKVLHKNVDDRLLELSHC